MTFDEWYTKDGLPLGTFMGYNLEDVSRRAWNAALSAAAEYIRTKDYDNDPYILARRIEAMKETK